MKTQNSWVCIKNTDKSSRVRDNNSYNRDWRQKRRMNIGWCNKNRKRRINKLHIKEIYRCNKCKGKTMIAHKCYLGRLKNLLNLKVIIWLWFQELIIHRLLVVHHLMGVDNFEEKCLIEIKHMLMEEQDLLQVQLIKKEVGYLLWVTRLVVLILDNLLINLYKFHHRDTIH